MRNEIDRLREENCQLRQGILETFAGMQLFSRVETTNTLSFLAESILDWVQVDWRDQFNDAEIREMVLGWQLRGKHEI